MSREPVGQASPVLQQQLGTLEVASRVFQDIVCRVAREVPGVADVCRTVPGFFRRARPAEAVRVERGQGEVALSVRLTVRYDVCIPDMVAELRRRATAAIEAGTGYRVRAMNVTIDKILSPRPERPERPERREPAGPPGVRIPDLPQTPGQAASHP
jgi:uncharacterized alkaline shock family protein YloU